MKKEHKEFCKRLTDLRLDRGLLQKNLSTKTKLDPAQISKYESGAVTPSIWTLKRIAKGLNVSADKLLGLA